jgi:hypothetical protein
LTGFREIFLEQLIKARRPAVIREIHPDKMQAFTRKEIESGIQLYQHLKNMGNTFDDLITFIETARRNESTSSVKSAITSAVILTREQRKHMKLRGGTKGRQRRDN